MVLTVDFGSAQTSVAYQFYTSAGAMIATPVTTGITNISGGLYSASATIPGTAVGVLWTCAASGVYANEDLSARIAVETNLDVLVSSRSTFAGGAVASVAGSVGSIATGGIVAASFGAGAIDAAAIATDAIGSAELAASAVTKIQAGLALATALVTAQSDLDDIQARLPAALVSGRMDASIGAMAANTLNASALAPDAVTEIQAGLGAGLDAAGVRTAVGLASANLDAQLSGISNKTTNLPGDPADASDIATAFGALNTNLATVATSAATAATQATTAATAAASANTAAGFIKIVTDKLDSFIESGVGGLFRLTTAGLINAPSGGGAGGAGGLTTDQDTLLKQTHNNSRRLVTNLAADSGTQVYASDVLTQTTYFDGAVNVKTSPDDGTGFTSAYDAGMPTGEEG